jgi:ketosteroid isomerase-like protein
MKALKVLGLSIVVVTLATGVAAAQQAAPEKELIAKVQKLHDELDRLQVSGSPEQQAALFAEDVLRMDPNRPAAKGKEEFLSGMKRMLASEFAVTSAKTEVLHAWQSGNMIFEYGTGTLHVKTARAGAAAADPIKYFMAWSSDPAGSYKVQYVIWNTSQTVPATELLAK